MVMSGIKEQLAEAKKLKFLAKADDDGAAVSGPIQPQEPPATPKTGRTPKKAARKAPAARKRAAPPKPPAKTYPWQEGDARVPQVFNLRFDEVTYLKLKWIGTTQWGESMHGFAMAAVKKAIEDKLRELGAIDENA
jgi:hypothetical protein